MKRQWTYEELTDHFTLSSKELDLIGDSKTDHNLLGFGVLLKYFQYEGRFPSQKHDIPLRYNCPSDPAIGSGPGEDHSLRLGRAYD